MQAQNSASPSRGVRHESCAPHAPRRLFRGSGSSHVRKSLQPHVGSIGRLYHVVAQTRGRIRVVVSSCATSLSVLNRRFSSSGDGIKVDMGSLLSKVCSGATPPLLSLNDTCQRLRCLMACCGGEVNVVSRENDVVDNATQTENEEEEEEEEEENGDNEEGQNERDDETSRFKETSV